MNPDTRPLSERYKKSLEHWQKAKMVTPDGAQTMSKAGYRFPTMFPKYLVGGYGAHVRDIDNNEYIDWVCALGAVSLGYHALPNLNPLYSLPTPLEAEVTEQILKHVAPWAESVRFVTTGSEACQAAVRIARRHTNRDHVVVIGYHGWHDWVQASSAYHPGVPIRYQDDITRVTYGHLDQVENTMKCWDLAAVMLEPTCFTPPPPKYLENLRTICTLHGAMLIFDEMVMGFRWAMGGGSEFFGVIPDLATYGKALGNGYPIACVVGSRDVMKGADVVSGTFGGSVPGLVMAQKVIRAAIEGASIRKQWEYGARFQQVCRALHIPIDGYPVHPRITYPEPAMSLFLQETARRGLLLHPGGFNVSAALTKEDMRVTEVALEGAVEAIQTGAVLEGEPGQLGILQRIS